ncbi:Ubiquitin carboxyl-terminal hydrolase [Actinidia chinensis var. chinensis]|uniref:Ubiquitin carboxyl-terminal hydrolase n=1 Tax=Actinidia chinensis var. chinensis TaxID=1590841 RepID=A0A2R6P8I0_ACTCC|nr:Ubiquitin carboxyl-terminal hydrolase [Actinidia chinensis var. chinensis]
MAPTPKRSFLPLLLLFLLSLSALFLFSLYHSSARPLHSSPSFLTQRPCNPTSQTTNDNKIFTLVIKVLAFDRLSSLSRCLRSLSGADYGGDRVNLHVYIDHLKNLGNGSVNLDEKLNESRRILDFVDGFSWKFGKKMVHYRTGNVGLQAQWLEAWWPSSDDEFAFVVEDDLEVSPLYYKFLRGLIENYYYNASNFSPWIYGASLQRPRFVPGKHGNKLQLDSDAHIFLYQLVGTWGQLLFPRPWKEFRLWYDTHKAKGIKPFLQGMVTTGWYKKMGERIWTPWFIKFIHSHGYFNLYTSFSHERALSVSHRDAGVNYGKTAGPDSYLLDKNSLDFDLLEMQPLSKLKWYDFCFRRVLPDRVVRSINELGSVLHSLQRLETVILVSIHKVPQTVTRNLLCHFERQNIQNYILVGSESNFLLDFARQGHPVIDADQFLDNMQARKFKKSSIELVKAYVVKKTLELGYNIGVMDGNTLPVSGDLFLDLIDPHYDFYFGNTFKVLLVKSSSSAKKIWVEDFIYKVAVMVESSKSKDDGNFVYIVAKLLEQMGVKNKGIDEMSFDLSIDASNRNQTSLADGKKMVFWSYEMGTDLIRKRLEELGMWVVDGDSSCMAVVCHQS